MWPAQCGDLLRSGLSSIVLMLLWPLGCCDLDTAEFAVFYCRLPRWSQVLHGNTDFLMYILLVWLVLTEESYAETSDGRAVGWDLDVTHTTSYPGSVQLPALFSLCGSGFCFVLFFWGGGFPRQILYNTEPLLCYNVETGRHLRTVGYMTLDWCFIVFLTDSLMTGDSLISRWSHRADKTFSFSRAEGDCTLTRSLFILLLPFKNDQRHI